MKFIMMSMIALFSVTSFATDYSSFSVEEVFGRGYKVKATLKDSEGMIIHVNRGFEHRSRHCVMNFNQPSENARVLPSGRQFMITKLFGEMNFKLKVEDKTIQSLDFPQVGTGITIRQLGELCNLDLEVIPAEIEQASELDSEQFSNNV